MRASIALRFALLAATASCTRRVARPSPQGPAAREAILLTSHDLAPGRRRCRIVDPNVALPDVRAVLDTAAMPDYLRQAGVAASDTGYALFSVRFDTTGKPVRARLIEATLPDSLHSAMQQAVASALIERGAGAPLALRLRIDFAPAARYRVGKSEYCEPEQIAHNATTDPRGAGPSPAPGTARSVTTFQYEVDISETGQVTAVHAAQPLEEGIQSVVFAERWKPAFDDGLPVAARVSGTFRRESWLEVRPVAH